MTSDKTLCICELLAKEKGMSLAEWASGLRKLMPAEHVEQFDKLITGRLTEEDEATDEALAWQIYWMLEAGMLP